MARMQEKQGNLRGSNVSDLPPALDPSNSQFGTNIGGMNIDDIPAGIGVHGPYLRGTASDLRVRNAERFAIATPGASPTEGLAWAIATPDSEAPSSPQKPTKVLGAAEALFKRMLPYGSGAKVTGEDSKDVNYELLGTTPTHTKP